MRKFALDILWEKYGIIPFWMSDAVPVVKEYLNIPESEAENQILNSMVGGSIYVVGSSETIVGCCCDGDAPHTHYGGNLKFKFNTAIWNPIGWRDKK